MIAVHRALDTWRKSVTRFVTLTAFARREFIDAGFPAEKFLVKPNFVDPDPGERRKPGDYAVYVGRLFEDKGLPVLLDAWKEHPVQFPLHIVGDGPERQALEEQAGRLQLSNVTFRGRLSRDHVIEEIKGARFVIVPSIWYEGFPMAIVESFACGTPVICSRLGGMAEIVEDRVTGLHFNPGDAKDLADKAQWAFYHREELLEMGRAARRVYETKYTAEQNYSVLMKIYQEATAENNSGAAVRSALHAIEP